MGYRRGICQECRRSWKEASCQANFGIKRCRVGFKDEKGFKVGVQRRKTCRTKETAASMLQARTWRKRSEISASRLSSVQVLLDNKKNNRTARYCRQGVGPTKNRRWRLRSLGCKRGSVRCSVSRCCDGTVTDPNDWLRVLHGCPRGNKSGGACLKRHPTEWR